MDPRLPGRCWAPRWRRPNFLQSRSLAHIGVARGSRNITEKLPFPFVSQISVGRDQTVVGGEALGQARVTAGPAHYKVHPHLVFATCNQSPLISYKQVKIIVLCAGFVNICKG